MSRYLLILLITALIVPLGCSSDKDAGEENIEWLFVQNAEFITLKDNVLILEGISPSTLFFSNRPERVAAHGLTSDFVTYWGDGGGPDNFMKDPPNATLSIVTKDMVEDVVLTLKNPRLDGETLQYDVTIIDGDDSVEGGPGSLFIDVVGRPATPVSAAGAKRRRVRRIAY